MNTEAEEMLHSAQCKIEKLMSNFEFGSPNYNELYQIFSELKVAEYHL
jgi:hypothetical protein